ncbi:MAG: heme exporter protein CcmD [Gammaproteobacteria bacterium]|nr:heme exporter protein CcmD [Gammaproteobacteria bacterium]
MDLETFFHMGGYAFYVWSSYGLSFVVLLMIFLRPMMSKKRVMKDLRTKYRQQERQNNQAR